MNYRIQRAATPPHLSDDWSETCWADADTLTIAEVRSESSEHHPETRCRLLYDEAGNINPHANASRGDAAELLYNIFTYVGILTL